MSVIIDGYAWLPSLWRRHDGEAAIRTRMLGLPAVALRGPDAVRFFYDETHVRRHGAIPEPVQGTLFGHGAIHTLDGARHRHRKAMFLSLLTGRDHVGLLLGRVSAAWSGTVSAWAAGRPVVLFDEAARAITRGVCDWAGIPLADDDVAPLARDLTAMVDGFATPGPRHWRARRARARRERWLAAIIEQARAAGAPKFSALETVAAQTDTDGRLLDPRCAAVELLNIIRPTVAVAWFVAFTAHALHRWPEHRARLRDGDREYAVAFANEVRRFYPFAPFVGGRAAQELTWRDVHIPAGSLVLLDIFGQNHDAALWPQPYRFDPGRFLGREPERDTLIPQGGGDRAAGHRCPGEDVTLALMSAFAIWLSRLAYDLPEQDLTISLRRIPALPRSRIVVTPGFSATPNGNVPDMTSQTPDSPLPIATVNVGMTVVDADGEEAGKVTAVQMPGTDVRPDAPAGVAEQLLATGYVRVDGTGFLSNDTYASGDQIQDTVEGEPGTVNLRVRREELFRTGA